jgi:hypothetical protein
MSRTIGSFSDLAKIQMGELDLDVRRVALGEVMQGAFDTLLPEARADQLALTLDMDPSMGGLLLDCDRARVIQTVEQLYACLVHALSAPGGVRLSARREKAGDAARLEVEASAGESGPLGSGQRELPRPELALAKGLISLHGGSLDVGAEGRTLRLSFSMPTSSAGVARREPAKEASDGY